MPTPRIIVLPLDHADPALRWSVVSHMPRRRATVFAARKREAQLLGAQLMNVSPDRVIAVESPEMLPGMAVA